VVADVGAVAGDSTRARARALEAVELYERKGDLVSVALARERA
jgi:hypothetical protein